MMGDVKWREIPGHPGIEASDTGLVRSWRGTGTAGRRQRPKVLSQYDNRGYKTVGVGNGNGGKKHLRVHHAVLMAFAGPPGPGYVCRHLNGDRLDNRIKNLKWGTHEENWADRRAHGRVNAGKHAAKLTPADVLGIRNDGRRYRDVAADYGVSPSTVCMVKKRKVWADV